MYAIMFVLLMPNVKTRRIKLQLILMNSNSCLQLSKNYLIYLRTHSQVWSHDAKFRENAQKNNLDTDEIVT